MLIKPILILYFSLPRFLFNTNILRILNLEYVVANSLYILSFDHKIMNKIGIILATAAAFLTVIALVMQLSEPVSAQRQLQLQPQQEQFTPFVIAV